MNRVSARSARAAAASGGAPRVLMLGTDPGGRGGVATVVSLLQQDGLFEREDVCYVPTHAEGGKVARMGAFLKGMWGTLRCLARGVDVVHAHAASYGSFVRKSLLLALARVARRKTVFHLHGACFDSFVAGSGSVMRRWIRHTLQASSVVIALSTRWAAFVQEFAPRARVVVIPNSVPLPPARADEAEPGRILFLGQVEPRKGICELLGALALLKDRFPSAKLAIGGQGGLEEVRRRAQALGIADRVSELGWVTAGQKAQELARAAIFCLPSHAEGLPMAMLEAMAAGKAVVTTGVGGIPDAVADGENGLLVVPGDVEALAAALGRLLGDDEERRRLGERARATIRERFESGVVIEQISGVYEQLRRH